ncbi:MAG: hypothetical protein ACTH2Q_16730 [Propionibacteriaceae bacterium]
MASAHRRRPPAWALVLLALIAAFGVLRGVHAMQPESTVAPVQTDRMVVVGVEGRPQLTDTDRAVLDEHADGSAVGAMSIRAADIGACSAAGWATLGAGRRASVQGPDGADRCDIRVTDLGVVYDWRDWEAAAAANRGDARLGTLADSSIDCVASVGTGAALAAAHSDGTSDAHLSIEDYIASGHLSPCPLTIVDAGDRSDEVINALAGAEDVTLVVTGVGPAAGSADPALQVAYRIGSTPSGWLTSASTRREGIVTLPDLTRTMIDFTRIDSGPMDVPVDGTALAVYEDAIGPDDLTDHLSGVAALSASTPPVNIGMGVFGGLLFIGMVLGLWQRRFLPALVVITSGTVWLASMMLTGVVPWWRAGAPTAVLGLTLAAVGVVLTAGVLWLRRATGLPAAVLAALVTTTAFTLDAASGGLLEPGSLLNSRPIFGWRWYGFGNVTFAAYAAAALFLAGYVAHRLVRMDRRRWAAAAVLGIGLAVVVCEGWPSMGADFGGVIGLTPGVLWLAASVSGIRFSWWKWLAVAAVTVLAVGLISVLDWQRGPGARTHLGNFVQRIVDGDAIDVVFRKAMASIDTIISPLGIGSLLISIPLWIVLFRHVLPLLEDEFVTLRATSIAALLTAVLGTVLNDGGISVWITLVAAHAVSVASLWLYRSAAEGHLLWRRPTP